MWVLRPHWWGSSVFNRLSLNKLPLVVKVGRKKNRSSPSGEQSLFILAALRCLNLLSRLPNPQERRFVLLFCFFYKAGAKRHKDVFLFFSPLSSADTCESSAEDVAPPFLVFQDELSSASFLGRPPASSSPLDGSSTAAESCFIGGWGVTGVGGVGVGGGGSVCRAATGSAVMNRRESSTVSQGRSRFFFSPRFHRGVTLAGDAAEMLSAALIDGLWA